MKTHLHMIFYNSYTNESLGDVKFPYDRSKSMNGFYSNFWKGMRIGLSNLFKVDKRLVRMKLITTIKQ